MYREPTRIGLLGCGAVAQLYYAPALRELQAEGVATLAAIYDPSVSSLMRVADQFPAAARLETSQIEGVDLVIIASPVRFHAPQAIESLNHGMSVLCEKPLATSVSEAERMIAAAEAAGRILAVGLVRRFYPACRAIKEILLNGSVGTLSKVTCFEGGPFRWPAQSASFFDKAQGGGGVLLDIGAHILDLITWWLGMPSDIHYEDDAMGGVEANCHLTLKYGERFVDIRLSRDWSLPNRYLFECSGGWFGWTVNEANDIQLSFAGSEFVMGAALHDTAIRFLEPTAGPKAHTLEQSFTNQLRNVVDAVRGTAPVAVPAREAIPSLRLIEHCYKNRRLMNMNWLSPLERERATQLAGRR